MLQKALKIVALILFVLAVFHVNLHFDPIAAGLALWVGSEIV